MYRLSTITANHSGCAGLGFINNLLVQYLEILVERVANYFKLTPKELSTNSKAANVSRARAVLCYHCVHQIGYSGAEVARKLNITPSTVSEAVVRGGDIVFDEMKQKNFTINQYFTVEIRPRNSVPEKIKNSSYCGS